MYVASGNVGGSTMEFPGVLTSISSSQWLKGIASFAIAHLPKTPLDGFLFSVFIPLFCPGQVDQAIARSEQLFGDRERV